MATVDLSDQTFESAVLEGGIVLVDFWADWCGPCKAFAPIYDSTSAANDDIVFAKVDTDANQNLSAAMGIQAIPTLMAFRDGIGVFSQAGALPRPPARRRSRRLGSIGVRRVFADVAQLVEHFTRNEGVRGSSPRVGSGIFRRASKRVASPRGASRWRPRSTRRARCVVQ